MGIRATEWPGVYTDGSWLLTRNLNPGVSVYGESLHVEGGVEFRRWDVNRSKLAAYLKCGGRVWPFGDPTSVLYLGAGNGTTVSHLSDVCRQGTITAIEISPRAFRDLLQVADVRSNVLPILGDAAKPETYGARTTPVSVLYQDLAQREQAAIFRKNLPWLQTGGVGFFMIKARSEDVAANPTDVYEAARKELVAAGVRILDRRILAPYQTDHAVIVVKKP
jgi:fibrillarin-like pre-rRNA processing protein